MIKSPITKKPRKPIRKQSPKKAAQNRERGKAYTVLDHEWERGECQGCGQYCSVIDHSHLLSQARFPHLAAVRYNIVPHCRSCHQKWESPTQRWKMKDFVENMIKIQGWEPREFERMLVQTEWKLEQHYEEELPKFLELKESLLLP